MRNSRGFIFLLLVFSLALHATAESYQVEMVLDNLDFPLAMAFAPDGRLFYAEKNTGNVQVVQGDSLLTNPWVTVPNVDPFFERGLLGICLDPGFDSTGYVYLYYTTDSTTPPENRVIRYTDVGGVGQNPIILLQAPVLTGASNHNGGNLHFGPDGMLYVTIGENANPAYAQDSTVLYGKILRLNKADGSAPTDNPFYGLPGWEERIFAWGLRNSYDFTFDSLTGNLFATENGPACDDEINLIIPRGNYGWRPSYPCGDTHTNYIQPLLRMTPTTAPTGAEFYTGSEVPQWQNNFFFAEWNTGNLNRVVLNEPDRDSIVSMEVIDLGGAQCRLDIKTGPDGALWFTTSNWISGTGKIYRIVGDSVSVEEEPETEIRDVRLNFTSPSPNPFTSKTQFTLTIPNFSKGEASNLSLSVVDIVGRRVKDLLEAPLEPGIHHLTWDGKDEKGIRAGSGVYFLLLRLGEVSVAQKVTFLQTR